MLSRSGRGSLIAAADAVAASAKVARYFIFEVFERGDREGMLAGRG